MSSESSKETNQFKMSMKPEYTRKTRMTFNFGAGNDNLNAGKLKHLARMHAIVEFFLLIQDHTKFSTDCYQHIGEFACNKYMGANSPIQNVSHLQKCKLCDLTLIMDCVDATVIKELVCILV